MHLDAALFLHDGDLFAGGQVDDGERVVALVRRDEGPGRLAVSGERKQRQGQEEGCGF